MKKPPPFKTKAQLAYEYLRDAIISAALKPGTRVMPSQVAEELGVSEVPVREAFRMLESEGLLEITPHVGAQVTAIKPEEVEEVFLIRTVLEAFAARTVAGRYPPEGLDHLRELLADMERAVAAGDFVLYGRLNTEFHRSIYSATPFGRLRKLIYELWDSNERSRSVFLMVPERVAQSLAEHKQIVEALELGDGRQVEVLLRHHKGRSFAELLEQVEATDEHPGRKPELYEAWQSIVDDHRNGRWVRTAPGAGNDGDAADSAD